MLLRDGDQAGSSVCSPRDLPVGHLSMSELTLTCLLFSPQIFPWPRGNLLSLSTSSSSSALETPRQMMKSALVSFIKCTHTPTHPHTHTHTHTQTHTHLHTWTNAKTHTLTHTHMRLPNFHPNWP